MTTDFSLDRELQLLNVREGVFQLCSSVAFNNMAGSQFGGWVAAAMVKAVEQDPAFRGGLISQSVQFIAAANATTYEIEVTALSHRRSVDFWRVLVRDADDTSKLVAAADIVTGLKGEAEMKYFANAPTEKETDVADAVRIDRQGVAPVWVDQFDYVITHSTPFQDNGSPRSVVMIRSVDGRPLDAISLAAIADCPMPRTFFLSDNPPFAATLSMATYVYATPEEISETGNDYVIVETTGAVINHAAVCGETTLFRRDGLVLATSYQTGRYRKQ